MLQVAAQGRISQQRPASLIGSLIQATQMQAMRHRRSVLLSEKFVKASAEWILKHSGAKE